MPSYAIRQETSIRQIRVGEMLKRIFGKAVATLIKGDIVNAVGSHQLSEGQEGGCEIACKLLATCMRRRRNVKLSYVFTDATNAFNSLNRTSLLKIQRICPKFSEFIKTHR